MDKTIPLASKVLVELSMNSLSSDQQKHGTPQVRRWRKIKNLKAMYKYKTEMKHNASGVGNKQRNKVETNGD